MLVSVHYKWVLQYISLKTTVIIENLAHAMQLHSNSPTIESPEFEKKISLAYIGRPSGSLSTVNLSN